MKKLCRPVFTKCQGLPNVGDLCTSARYPGKLLVFGKFEGSYLAECT